MMVSCGGGGSTFGAGGPDSGATDAVAVLDATKLNINVDASSGKAGKCQPLTCAKLKYTCGPAGDGCGGKLDCGSCTAPASCGGGGTFSQCGGSSVCVAKTCKDIGVSCGPAGDGCGGLLNCGACTGSDSCGGGGKPSVCGTSFVAADGGLDGGACVPLTCASQAIFCGPAGDGCGNTLDCGSCATGQTCGGGGTAYQCGSPAASCVATTCTALGFNCGPAADGCGGVLDCGDSCPVSGDICGGAGKPGVCGDVPACTGLCLDQVTCEAGGTTTLSGQVVSGTVSAYGTPDPVPNVLVYVPNGTPAAFPTSLDCGCAPVTGYPVTSTTTDYQGNFTLTNVPVPAGGSVPLVIQLGRWRRYKGLSANVTACTTNSAGTIRMPRTQAEGDIPRTAISTGGVDAMECVLLKMGVDPTEFTDPGGTGAIQLFLGNGAFVDGNSSNSPESTRVPYSASTATLDNYDQVIFPCWGVDPRSAAEAGTGNQKTAIQQTNVTNYTNGGGRMFATHFSYSWLYNDAPFSTTATWNDDLQYTSGTANIPDPGVTEPDVTTFYQWMNNLAVGGADAGTFTVETPRNDFSAISTTSELWSNMTGATKAIKNEPTTFPLIYTFPTPVGSTNTCGKVIYSDMHVSTVGGTGKAGQTFPAECTTGAMSSQEKALEYLIWDLAACPPGPPAPSCTPLTCAQLGTSGYNCGPAGDGCGGTLDCGTCSGCQTCGGASDGNPSQPGVCGGSCCQPTTCTAQSITCGPAGDGCGGTLSCGSCATGQSCGGAGLNGQCGAIDSGACTPLTCKAQGFDCGPAGDGCGGQLACGTCPSGETCGGGGKNGVCGKPACTPKTCGALGYNCGPAGDGCGGLLNCGTCAGGAVCGANGTPGQCSAMTAK